MSRMSANKGSNPPKAVVVFFHGYGGDDKDIFSIGENWCHGYKDLLFVAPCAKTPTPFSMGYEWFPLPDVSKSILRRNMNEKTPLIAGDIQNFLLKNNYEALPLFLAGFSQGAMVALDLSLQGLLSVKGVLAYSGILLNDPLIPPSFPVFLYHGDHDDVVDVTFSENAHHMLQEKGFDVEAHLVKGLPHSIDMRGLEKGLSFIKRHIPK